MKLGDFGLSKIMASHDFASTYVGTPFYMSPEICAAEQYSLHSDIWAFGCIMYELCMKEPPFIAKTHMELIQKIRLGRVTPLPHMYSSELKDAISRCLRVNPSTRPDTVQLLNIPMVKLKRKELEVVRIGHQLKRKEEQVVKALKDAEKRLSMMDNDKAIARAELENQVRREWEVKARLEIDKRVQQTRDQLRKEFEAEVSRRVSEAIEQLKVAEPPVRSSTPDLADLPEEKAMAGYYQSQSTSGETDDFPSMTDLSELSLESPTVSKKKTARTPFARAQTMFDGSPADVMMADPSPAPIASLNLSPRRNFANPRPQNRNIFATAASSSPLDSDAEPEDDDDDENDFVPALSSPTRAKHPGDPFKALNAGTRRPGMPRQKTAPLKPAANSQIFPAGARQPMRETSHQNLLAGHTKTTRTSTSPKRPASKLPSASGLAQRSTSPLRRPAEGATSPQRHPQLKKSNEGSHVQGRTLVELAQAKASSAAPNVAAHDFGNDLVNHDIGSKKINATGKEDIEPRREVPVWDPERDEMPSPFLVRGRTTLLAGARGGPGMRHLR